MIKLKEIVKEIDIPDNMRIHMSHGPITLKNVSPQQEDGWYKPYGLWYGFGNSWINWVRDNVPDWEGTHIYEVIFPNTKNIKKVSNTQDAAEFTKEFQVGEHPFLNWQKVAQNYEGIEMNPYHSNLRWEYPWYFSLEVASGCVWNFSRVRLRKL